MEFKPDITMTDALKVAKQRAFRRGYDLYIAKIKSMQANEMPWDTTIKDVHGEMIKIIGEWYPTYSIKTIRGQINKWANERTPNDAQLLVFSELFYGKNNAAYIFLDAYKDMCEYYDELFVDIAKRTAHLRSKTIEQERAKERTEDGLVATLSKEEAEEVWES